MIRYREIADALRSQIQTGKYPVGTKLPGISALQETYGWPSLNTVRAAQQLLVDEGMLQTRQGVGAFVIRSSPLRQVDVGQTLAVAQEALGTAIAALNAHGRLTIDLDDNTSYVLTEGLRHWARHLQREADVEGKHIDGLRAEMRDWAATAEALASQVELAHMPAAESDRPGADEPV